MIEFERILFASAVVLFHANKEFVQDISCKGPVHWSLCVHGACAVEFFFIVSGYLMARTCARLGSPQKEEELARDTTRYLWSKVRPLLFYHVVMYVASVATFLMRADYGLGKACIYVVRSIPSLFFIQMYGFNGANPNNVEWYLSVMLAVMLVFYPLIRRHYALYVRVVGPAVALFLYGWLCQTAGRLSGVMVWDGFAFRAMYRGVADITLGTILFEAVSRWDGCVLSHAQRFAVGGAFIFVFVSLLASLNLSVPYRSEFVVLVLIALLVVLSFTQHNPFNDVFARFRAIEALGRLSTPLYLSQVTAMNIVCLVFVGSDATAKVVAMFVLTLLLALLLTGLLRMRHRRQTATDKLLYDASK